VLTTRRRYVLRQRGGGGGALGAGTARIILTGQSMAENSAAATAVGTLSVVNATGTPTFTLTGNDGNRFALNGDGVTIQAGATNTNYDVDGATRQITVEVSGTTPAIDPTVFDITITNELEVTLAALSLDDDTVSETAMVGAVVGAIQDATSGSTLSLIDTDGGKYALDGLNIDVAAALAVGSDSITVRETHPDASNSPRDTVIAITVSDDAPTITSTNAVSLAENAAFSHTLTANEAVTWTKTGGADAALFTLVGNSLTMTAKDYDTPSDADTNNTYVVQITATDAALNATNQTVTVTVTNVTEDATPNAFTFVDETSATLSTVYTSNAITVLGIDGATAISVVGGEYRINAGSWVSTPGTVVVNDSVDVRLTTSGSYSTAANCTLTIGGVSDTFTVTTIADPGGGGATAGEPLGLLLALTKAA
jgi:hypothetical protein